MMMTKPVVGAPVPEMSFEKLGGGQITLGANLGRHLLFIIYRGKHCGRCKRFLGKLESTLSSWEGAGIDVAVVSADPIEKAQADVSEYGWSFDVGYGLSEEQMAALGVYISDPISPDETDRRFAEPATFFILPGGEIQIAAISNGPAARPDLEELLDGMKFNISNNRPTRGLV